MIVIKIAGNASQVFKFLGLLARRNGDDTIGLIAKKYMRRMGFQSRERGNLV